MPTYEYRCPKCGREDSVHQSIHGYVNSPIRPRCHGEMDRKLSVSPGLSGIANALAGDRHYDGLRATDGRMIDTRTKHRAYMKEKGYTIVSDFKDTWADAAKERSSRRAGTYRDPELKKEITQAVMTAVAKSDTGTP